MIKLYTQGVYVVEGKHIIPEDYSANDKLAALGAGEMTQEQTARGTIAYSILMNHNVSESESKLKLKFDSLASHDITYVGIVQTARASGLERFPIPYVLTNCHNSLCAVGGTINEDDHMFGLSAAKKYGGIYVPAHQAVIHQYVREMITGCGEMILGSDSHTRYGSLGSMGIGEGGPELVKQLLGKTYDLDRPEVVAVYLTGEPVPGVGPQDVALAIIGEVFPEGFVNNKVLEFIGDGINSLSVEYRNGIDVMTTETTCLSSIWQTDEKVEDYYQVHGRKKQYKKLQPANVTYYDGMVYVNLSKVRPMIALPFHPSNAYPIETLNENLNEILETVERNGKVLFSNPETDFSLRSKIRNDRLYIDQGIIAGCAGGTYDNICDAADILAGKDIGNTFFSMSVYPASQPTNLALVENGSIARIMESGATVRTAFCGPCFGAGDVPANNSLSIRHTTRNFINREGSQSTAGQVASVALMDARSIAATAVNGGALTPATDLEIEYTKPEYRFNATIYKKRVYQGYGNPKPETDLTMGPNIKDWPVISPLPEHLLLQLASVIRDPVTTTDELIPSGETSSYRSNPIALAEFTLSRRDPSYVGRAKAIQKAEIARTQGKDPFIVDERLQDIKAELLAHFPNISLDRIGFGSAIYANKPGDGSAREQAASCQRVLGGWANLAQSYATKRYRSNLMNWGMLPFLYHGTVVLSPEDYLLIPDIRKAIKTGAEEVTAYCLKDEPETIALRLSPMTEEERNIILSGCLMNYYQKN